MEMQEIWNCETAVSELLGCNVPDWIDQDIAASTIASICQGGCASGAYMPAVTYYQASRIMSDHGDDVLQYIDDCLGELPQPERGESWSGLACFYLSCAVEIWASDILSQLESLDTADCE